MYRTSAHPFSQARGIAAASLLWVGLAIAYGTARAQAPLPTLPSTGTSAIATFESVGLYWQGPGGSTGCEVKYRKADETAWVQGLAMWYDARDTQCRGSLVSLAPNTYYQVEFNLPGQPAARGLVFKTWANQFPVSRTILVNSGSATLNVAESGTASGYVVYQGAPGAVLDAGNAAQFNVTINASYVILRGLALKGAQQDAIRISPTVKDVIIEDNDISGWGRTRDGTWGTDMDSGIRAVCSTPTMERITIQRNKIHDPRYSANSWSDGHPAGPQAITISFCGGNHVIRHNEMYSSSGKYFNDVIGGEDNFTKTGFPNADTDIYGNRLSHGWDDAIEAEGANENVRIWGNYMDRTAIGIATTVTSVGPAYIFRNVWNRAQFFEKAALDSDDRQPLFKSGSDATLGHGRRYFFHNTMLQATQAGVVNGLGGGFGMGGTGSSQLITNTWSMNNIYHLWKPGRTAFYQTGAGTQVSNDMYNGTPGDATIVNGINAAPLYAPGHGWTSEATGLYQLAAASPGLGGGIRIANFNDGAAAPDVGAHQSGSPAMAFGVAASPGSAVGAPSEPPPAPPPVVTYALGVTTNGTGAGTVTSSPAAINCGATCSASFTAGALVTLTATPSSGSVFSGWSGACSGTAACSVPMDSGKSVTATFALSTAGVKLSRTLLDFSGSNARKQKVTFTNQTGTSVTFIRATMSSTRYGQTNNCGTVSAGGSCTATVTYYANGSGSGIGTLTLTSTAPNSPHVVTLTNVAPAPPAPPPVTGSVATSTSGLTFGTTQSTQPVTYTNNTSATVTFIQASMSSTKFGQTNNCGEVAPGASCTANVTFYPGNGGTDSGTFTVTSTAPNSPHTVSLVAVAPG